MRWMWPLILLAGCGSAPKEFVVAAQGRETASQRAKELGLPTSDSEITRTVAPENNAAIEYTRMGKLVRDLNRGRPLWYDIPPAFYDSGELQPQTVAEWTRGLKMNRPLFLMLETAMSKTDFYLGRRYDVDTRFRYQQVDGLAEVAQIMTTKALLALKGGDMEEACVAVDRLLKMARTVTIDPSVAACQAAIELERHALRLCSLALWSNKASPTLATRLLNCLTKSKRPVLLNALKVEQFAGLNSIRLIGSEGIDVAFFFDHAGNEHSAGRRKAIEKAKTAGTDAAKEAFEARHWELHSRLLTGLSTCKTLMEEAECVAEMELLASDEDPTQLFCTDALAKYSNLAWNLALHDLAVNSAIEGMRWMSNGMKAPKSHRVVQSDRGFTVTPLAKLDRSAPREALGRSSFSVPSSW